MLCISNLTKVYRIYNRPTDRLIELLAHRKRHRDFFALKEVSFALEQGKSLGIVGENGSGKSTLLQLIAGVLTPTSGNVQYRGSVLGLLELGIGFHAEFTGKQNIFLYSDVLSLPRSLIKSKLDEIIAFSELGEFIDRPLKTYSTGMRMRLAFSLVATLDPDILIVDEALTVGDNYFQKKCIDHIMKIKEAGRTIIFCSHSTYQIGMFCEETLWLKRGAMEKHGDTMHVLAAYEAYQLRKSEQADGEVSARYTNAPVRITSIEILNDLPISRGEDLRLRIHTEAVSDDLPFHLMISLKFGADFGVYATGTHLSGKPPIRGRRREITVTYPKIPLLGGYYWFHVRAFDDQGLVIYHEKILLDPELEVRKENNERGFCYLDNQWEIK
ncbi:MAG: polysaccharide ABC transporter ATP-binding protein [Candidatus Competibacter sp.]|nr:polysaccharide ABC transporter ATP-binding protein [Candidatus Contendobacter sp.]MDS4040689.1 polysaccharide ABC transporter ATP-binding protein [Candidatus Competibacter sp.]